MSIVRVIAMFEYWPPRLPNFQTQTITKVYACNYFFALMYVLNHQLISAKTIYVFGIIEDFTQWNFTSI